MNGLVFYIGLGLGLAVASGLRPFLPLLLAGALASSSSLGLRFPRGHFHFLESSWWLLAVAAVLVLAYGAQLLLGQDALPGAPGQRSRPAPLGAAIAGFGAAAGALLFAGTLDAHHDAWWPGLLGGLLVASMSSAAVGPLLTRARDRLPDRGAREALVLYLDAAALLAAGLAALLHPLGYVLVALFALLLSRTRARSGERYAGLRILGR